MVNGRKLLCDNVMAGGSRQYVFIVRKYKNMRNLKLFMTNTISYNQHNGHYNKLFYITSHTGGFLEIKHRLAEKIVFNKTGLHLSLLI